MHCSQCGKEVTADARYCTHCGAASQDGSKRTSVAGANSNNETPTIESSGRSRIAWGIAGTIAFAILASQFGGFLGRQAADSVSRAERARTRTAPEIIVVNTTQDAGGLTEDDLSSPEVANAMREYMISSLTEKTERNLRENGLNVTTANVKVAPEVNVVVTDRGKVLVLKAWTTVQLGGEVSRTRAVRVMKLRGREADVVSCLRSELDFNVWSGPCGDRISKIMGITMP